MAESQSRWDASAQQYLTSSWHSNEAALQRMVDVVGPTGGVILDVATGAGHAAMVFAPYVDSVIASDTSKGMLDVAAAESARRKLTNISFEIADAQKLPFENAKFDGVICRVAAHHFPKPEAFLVEAYRVLKSGGFLLLIDTVGSDDSAADEEIHLLESLRDPSHVRDCTEAEWRDMARKAKFEVEFEETISKPLNTKEWMDRMEVEPETRKRIIEMIEKSAGWFREYLRPHGDGDMLTFHLREMLMLLRK